MQGYQPKYVGHIAVVSGYALVAYSDLHNEGGEYLAHKVDGKWHVLTKGGGAMDVDDIERYAPGIDPHIAKELFDSLGVRWSPL